MKILASARRSKSAASTEWGATVASLTKAVRVASSRRLPPHRTRVSFQSSPLGTIRVTLAASGRSRRAARWAITSLPRSVPAAITAAGISAPTSWASDSAMAAGA